MALTDYQRGILALLAARPSRDIDLFHDTRDALLSTWEDDRRILLSEGYDLDVRHQAPTFIEAFVRKGGAGVSVEWAVDSAFRFFPLVRGPESLPSLHPFDLATNKTLALIGRLEPRDWIDLVACHERIQQLGFLCWAACGKDPGTNPSMIVSEAGRSARYTQLEINGLSFEGLPPDAAGLAASWNVMLAEAREIIGSLPTAEAGTCVLGADGTLFRGTRHQLETALSAGTLRFHEGSIRGSVPRFLDR